MLEKIHDSYRDGALIVQHLVRIPGSCRGGLPARELKSAGKLPLERMPAAFGLAAGRNSNQRLAPSRWCSALGYFLLSVSAADDPLATVAFHLGHPVPAGQRTGRIAGDPQAAFQVTAPERQSHAIRYW